MKAHFQMMARYGAWANARLGQACDALSEAERTRDEGAFFGSVHGTLNHLVVADRIWMARITGAPDPGLALTDRPCADMGALHAARAALDAAWIALIDGAAPDWFASRLAYRTTAGMEMEGGMSETLAHVFNHQTHHRGQVHALLTRIAGEAPPLDLLYYLRETG